MLAKGKGVNDGEKLTDVVRPIDRTEMKDFRGGTEMHAAIFHLSRIARAGSIDGEEIKAGMDYFPLLDGKVGKNVRLGIRNAKGK